MFTDSPRSHYLRTLFFLLSTLSLIQTRAFAEAGKRRIDQQTLQQQKHNPRYFRTLPSVQIVPRQDSLIFSMNYSHTAVVSTLHEQTSTPIHEGLSLNGSSVQPLVAYTNDGFGLGLSGEFAETNSTYKNHLLNVEEVGIFSAGSLLNKLP